MSTAVRSTSGKGVARAVGVVVASVALVGVVVWTIGNPLGAYGAPKPPAPPTPTLTGPDRPVPTTATFTFSLAGATAYQCSLDGAAYATCTSTKTYTDLSETTHTFRVTATNGTSSPSAAASKTWTIADVTPPPKPTVTRAPVDSSGIAKFTLSDTEANVSYLCAVVGVTLPATGTPCTSPVQYKDLAPDDYCFRAWALDAAGNRSPHTEVCWSNFEKKNFGIAGTTEAAFYPGKAQALDLVLTNPNNQPIKVLTVTVTVKSATTKSGCAGPDNLVVDKQFTGTVIVPANTTKRLSEMTPVPVSQWPVLAMPDLADVNQDACKGATFSIDYTGTASNA